MSFLTPSQIRTAQAIVNLFETGHVLGDYGQVTVLEGDPGRLTYGRSQTTLGSGKLVELLRQYAGNPGAQFGAEIGDWLPALAAAGAALDTDQRLHNLLRACADDPVMRETQDLFFDEHFWQPAARAAGKLGIVSALGSAVVYDSFVHGSWARIRAATDAQVGATAQAGEQAWIDAYVRVRRQWLATHSIAILRGTVYRMDAFRRLIDLGQWGLPLPLVVRGAEISMTTLNGTPPGCYDGPAPGSRALSVQAPLQRGLDVRRVQLALSGLGADIKADGVFGGASMRCVQEVQRTRGLPATGVADIAFIGALLG
ncbi:chitosanase [Mitsuaria sp. PDC51]|uniref:chitosanase n=1 Tax=unclassified Roseateles TaxID=2626991 RepID=UPI0008E3CB0F|nr:MULTISPECIES: peptidoglycan-binding protein [unclassified Roseateles]MBB3292432.1 chitosanase [Mitsuaria sp. BK041]MBB3361649.1 chitosanase [Mitsuaria sp. BK045]SFR75122.1 chitosanase [Mitsuaria sp. PDC51]